MVRSRLHVGLLFFLGLGFAMQATAAQSNGSSVLAVPDVSFTLQTYIGKEGMLFKGLSGSIKGVVNPELKVAPGAVVQITLVNRDGAEHDIAVPDFDALSDHVRSINASTTIVFRANKEGAFPYFCTLPGHRAAGMEGKVVVGTPEATEAAPKLADIVRDPADLPPPVGDRPSQRVRIDLVTQELEGRLDDGVAYNFWTFNGKIPGPFLRVRVGDTVELHLKNNADSRMIHSIDLHAVTGMGGGAALTQAPPGQERAISFKALKPGLYVYHCATPMVAAHIANGMFGMILVEPEGGLPKVDHEFYVMQSELYTTEAFGVHGRQEESVQKLLAEQPEYFVFNGAVGALTTEHPMRVKTNDKVRIFFGVGGPNYTSSFHMIGEIFDRVYEWGSVSNPPLADVQTVSVPPGGATIAELVPEVPGRYILVDHALSRLERGLVGFMFATGKDRPDIYGAMATQ